MPSPDTEALERRLSAALGAEQVHSDAAAVAGFAIDGAAPRLVVRPRSQEEVQAVVQACGAAGAAVACWGGGASMGLGDPPTRLDVVLRLDALTRIVELDEANLNVTAEAGVRLDALQAALLAKRAFLPLDPPQAERVTVGGLVAANASGPSRLLYGSARDWVLGLRVVLPSGERIRCGGKVIKNVSGYDMNKLFIGSMGTLGVVTEATFKLLPAPAVRATVVAAFSEVAQLAAVVSRTLESHLLPEALEALDAPALRAVGHELRLSVPAGFALAASLAGSRETVERQVRDLERFFVEARALATARLDEAQGELAWRTIRDVHAHLGGTAEARVVAKIAVPIAHTLELFSAAEAMARKPGWRGAVTAHAGSGIVRAGFAVEAGAPETVRDGVDALRKRAERVEGSLVVESGPTALKRSLGAWGKPGDALQVMRRVKAEFDPGGLMSPGRFLGGI
jgi:glycolate oxidase FAD binding subunit